MHWIFFLSRRHNSFLWVPVAYAPSFIIVSVTVMLFYAGLAAERIPVHFVISFSLNHVIAAAMKG